MSDGLFDTLGDMMSQQLEEMNQTRDQFTQDIEQQNCESREKFDQFASRVFGGKKHRQPELPPAVQELVTLMQTVPDIIPVLRARADEYMADVNEAFANINAKYTPKPQEQPNGDVPSEQS